MYFEASYNLSICNSFNLNASSMYFQPAFLHCNELLDNHKKRLYTKDKEYYKVFKSYGISYTNIYAIDTNDSYKLLYYNV